MDKLNKIFILVKNKTFISAIGIWGIIFILQICFPSKAIFTAWTPVTIFLKILDFLKLDISFIDKFFARDGYIYVLLAIFIVLTCLYTFFLTWLIEKEKLFKFFLTGTIICIIASGFYFNSNCISYNSWTLTESVQLRKSCPEGPNAYYKPNYADYKKEIIIPNTIAGGMIGLHLALTLIGIIALVKLSYVRVKKIIK